MPRPMTYEVFAINIAGKNYVLLASCVTIILLSLSGNFVDYDKIIYDLCHLHTDTLKMP